MNKSPRTGKPVKRPISLRRAAASICIKSSYRRKRNWRRSKWRRACSTHTPYSDVCGYFSAPPEAQQRERYAASS